jgi:glyoxylase-like metal-dependent hydrolase (beta-lactamase superfamily II)
MAIAPGIHELGGTKNGWVRAFLIEHGRELTLIDTLADRDAHLVLERIHRLGRRVCDLKWIALTHAHRSHLGGLALLKELSGATVLSHRWEADIVSGQREAQRTPLLPRDPLRAYIPFQIGAALGFGGLRAGEVDGELKNGDPVAGLEVLHVPGHTPGHLAFYSHEHNALIAGDAIVSWPKLAAGWPSFTLNPIQHRASVQRLAALRPRVIGVGHGDPITDDAADTLERLAAEA